MMAFPPDLGEVLARGSCPSCGSPAVRRSRTKGRVEQAVKRVTELRPFRCQACGWRGLARAASGPAPTLARLPPLPRPTPAPPRINDAFDPGHPRRHKKKLQPVVRRKLTTVLSFALALIVAAAFGYFISNVLF